MSAKRSDETGIRIRYATLLRLREARDQLVEAVEQGQRRDVEVDPEAINPVSNGLSYDAVLCLLLDMRDRERAHNAKANERRKAKKARESGGSEAS